ncbi:MAG: hypothetical protein Q9227_005272 [Pyrenula ochraceoflavens]
MTEDEFDEALRARAEHFGIEPLNIIARIQKRHKDNGCCEGEGWVGTPRSKIICMKFHEQDKADMEELEQLNEDGPFAIFKNTSRRIYREQAAEEEKNRGRQRTRR